MNAEQKQRATELVSEWNTHYPECVGDRMAALLQELVCAPEAEPFAVIHLDGSFVHVEFKQSVASSGKFTVYTAPPAQNEPVGYLYTNVQSGEYHVSDYDDDYRGPERVLWCIEPVYRKTKGQS